MVHSSFFTYTTFVTNRNYEVRRSRTSCFWLLYVVSAYLNYVTHWQQILLFLPPTEIMNSPCVGFFVKKCYRGVQRGVQKCTFEFFSLIRDSSPTVIMKFVEVELRAFNCCMLFLHNWIMWPPLTANIAVLSLNSQVSRMFPHEKINQIY